MRIFVPTIWNENCMAWFLCLVPHGCDSVLRSIVCTSEGHRHLWLLLHLVGLAQLMKPTWNTATLSKSFGYWKCLLCICFPCFASFYWHTASLSSKSPLKKGKGSEAINLLYRDHQGPMSEYVLYVCSVDIMEEKLSNNVCVCVWSEPSCASESESQSMKLLGFCRSLRSRGRWGALHQRSNSAEAYESSTTGI